MHIVKLIPNKNSKYHFGEGSLGESSNIFHSSSLFSAIVNNFIKLYGSKEFDKYKEEIKNIKLSSMFPAIYRFKNAKNNSYTSSSIKDEILFIPKPMVILGFDKKIQKDIENKPKEVKKIKFISIDALREHNMGKLKKEIIGKEYLITNKEQKNFEYDNPENMDLFKKTVEQKVSIDRIKGITLEDEKGQLYTIEFIKPLRGKENKGYKNIVGFYFLIDFSNVGEELGRKIKASINLISDEGLGGKRSIGAGTFKKIIIDEFTDEFDEKNLNMTNLNNKYITKNKEYVPKKRKMTLSITVPKNDDEFKKFINYQLIKIGGYIYSPIEAKCLTKLKKNVYVLAEGSVCKCNDKDDDIKGDILDLKPENTRPEINHEVILNGKPILIPVVSYEELNKEGSL
jgi:CRISPR-associated protein Csm4